MARSTASAACDPAAVQRVNLHGLADRLDAQRAGHHRVAVEVAGEKPARRVDLLLGVDVAQPIAYE